MELNKIYNEDCLETLKRMPDGFIDLTVTSPPYNVDLGNNKYNKNSYDLYVDNLPHSDYIDGLRAVFSEVFKKTKAGGRCVINIGDGKNGKIPTHSDIIQMMVHIGWIPMFTIIWNKNTVSPRTAWGSWLSPSSPSFPMPFEYILGFCRNSYKLSNVGNSDLTKEEFIDWSYAMWTFSTERLSKVGHPAAFPVELPKRCIKMLTWVNDIIYDPFIGSGTTSVSALELNRRYVGSEISKEYCAIANERINKVRSELEKAAKQGETLNKFFE